MSNKISKCMFCGSTSYGKNCPWSAFKEKIHVHTDDHTKCSYCGSTSLVGSGCPHSPTKRHQSGANQYNGMAQESFILAYIMRKLSEPIYESSAYKMGILDLNGNIIKKPDTIEEHMAYSVIDSYLFKLRTLLGDKIDILNSSKLLESAIKGSKTPIEYYADEVKLKSDLQIVAKHFFEAINESKLPVATVEKIILETFIKTC